MPRFGSLSEKKRKIMCGVVEMNKEAEWAKTAPYCEFHRPTRRYTHSNRNMRVEVNVYVQIY
jgi:hypothetical protein